MVRTYAQQSHQFFVRLPASLGVRSLESRGSQRAGRTLDNAMLTPLYPGADLLLQFAEGPAPHYRHRHWQERHHCAQRSGHASLHRPHKPTFFMPQRRFMAILACSPPGDIVLALSYSARPKSCCACSVHLSASTPNSSLSGGCGTSTLAQASDIFLDTGVST